MFESGIIDIAFDLHQIGFGHLVPGSAIRACNRPSPVSSNSPSLSISSLPAGKHRVHR
jgi:hypothetical protein